MELRTRLGNMTGDIEKDLKTLSSFVFQQSEELRYLLHNLDVTNFNDLGLMRYENGRLQIYTEKLDIKAKELIAEFENANEQLKTTIEADMNGLRTEVEKDLGDVGKQISSVEQTANGLKSTVSSHTTSINNITNTTVPALQSQITQQANKISLVVSANGIDAASIVTAINSAGSNVKISADHVSITGLVTVSDLAGYGTVEINAGNIKAGGTISGVTLESESGNKKVSIEGGGILFPNGEISCASGYGMAIEADRTDLFIGTSGYRWDGLERIYSKIYFTSDGTTWVLTENGLERTS